jgi:DNA-nicking Smr family endonuclease
VDFGEILERWEREQRGEPKGGGKTHRPQGGRKDAVPPKSVHPLSVWLETHGVYDKDAEDPELQRGPAEEKRRLLARRPDAVIDLHGLTRDEAWNALEQFFENSRRRGFAKVAVIHGKGNHSLGGAVLKRVVREFIEHCPFAGKSGHGPAGGTGTTWVLLK